MPPQTPDPLNPTPTPNPTPNPAPVPLAPAPAPVPAAPQAPVAASPVAPAQPAPAGASAHVDLTKIVLPKKPGAPSVDSAQRINAGILFEQERVAAASPLPMPDKPEAKAPEPQAPKEQPLVKPLQTYQGDIESLVGEKQVSVVSIAAAEAERRGSQPLEQGDAQNTKERRTWITKTLIIALSALLVAAAVGIGLYIFVRMQPLPLAQQAPAPFIAVDETETVVLQPGDLRPAIMNTLVAARDTVSLSLGLVARLQIAKTGPLNDGTLTEVGAPELLQALAPSIPLELVRTLEPQMLLGVHSFDENQAFMILSNDSYETAYSGMLAWEASMRSDLAPLFSRKPPVHAAPPAATGPVATTTASSSPTATSTAATSSEIVPPQQLSQSTFVDQIVENRDTRVVLNQQGDILLLWTFLDRNTIVIATNDATLREVVSRISQASILSLPPSQ